MKALWHPIFSKRRCQRAMEEPQHHHFFFEKHDINILVMFYLMSLCRWRQLPDMTMGGTLPFFEAEHRMIGTIGTPSSSWNNLRGLFEHVWTSCVWDQTCIWKKWLCVCRSLKSTSMDTGRQCFTIFTNMRMRTRKISIVVFAFNVLGMYSVLTVPGTIVRSMRLSAIVFLFDPGSPRNGRSSWIHWTWKSAWISSKVTLDLLEA